MKKVLSFVLCLSMVLSLCAAFGLAVNAEGASVSATVVNGSVKILTDKLALLCDGNDAASATAFGDAGLVAFENTGFTHTDGVDAAVEATVEFVLDLGEVKPIGGAYMTFFKDSASMIALPEIVFEGSADGDCWLNLNAGGVVAAKADAAEGATATLKADFTTRAVYNVRYVKATATFKNGWIFAGEIGTIAGKSGVEAVEITEAYAYTEGKVPSPGIGVFTEGTFDLSANDGETGLIFKNSQITVAKKNASGNYVISRNDVNPWPDGHSGTVTLGEGEILVAIATGGALTGEAEKDPFSAAKWTARGLSIGDVIVLDEENGTIVFAPAEHFASDEPSAPEVETKIELVSAGKSYTTSQLFRQNESWQWGDDAPIAYPDEDGKTLTDGVFAPADAHQLYDTTGAAWMGFHSMCPDYEEIGYGWMTIDLGASYDLTEVVLYTSSSVVSGATVAKITALVSNDGENWTEFGVAEPVDDANVTVIKNSIEGSANGRYVQYRIVATGYWMGVCEAEVYAAIKTVGGEPVVKTPANLETDIGIMYIGEPGGYEGVTTLIVKPGTYNFIWDKAALLEPVSGNTYKVIALAPGGGVSSDLTVAEGQIIVGANSGNDWPTLTQGEGWWTGGANGHGVPYDECPNFCSTHVVAWFNIVGAMQVGDYYDLVGIDMNAPAVDANYPVDFATDPSYGYTNADYVTYTYLTPNTDIDVSMMGAAPENSGFTATLTGPETWEAGKDITVDVTIEVTGDSVELSQIMFNLYYTDLELVLPEDIAAVITTAPDSWKTEDSLFGVSEVDGYTCLTGAPATVNEADVLKKGDKIVITLTFKVLDTANVLNLQLSHNGLNGYGYEDPLEAVAAGTGSNLVIAKKAAAPETGDAGIYVIAALALVALLGTAVVIKKRA